MLKAALRLNYISLRNKLTEEEVRLASLAIANNALNLPIWSYNYYHLFLQIPEKKEINTAFLLSILQGKDKNIVIPKVHGNSLQNYLLTDNTRFKKSRWGIPEPVDGIAIPANRIDLVFVPLLAFDLKGNRVGYGKGFYDNFLVQCNPDVLKIGLSFFEAEQEITDIEDNDIPLNYCITPNKIYEF